MQRPVHKTASSTSQSVSNASNMKVRSKTAPYREISPRTAVLRQPLPEGTEPDAFQPTEWCPRSLMQAGKQGSPPTFPLRLLGGGAVAWPWLDHAPLDGSVIPGSGADRRPRHRAYALRPQHRFVAKGPGEAAGDTGAPAPWRTQAAWVPAPPDATEQWVHR
jgi:hypothetical protein